jgi:cold shock protein
VRVWYREEGWGVIDSPDTPGGCWVHFSHLWNDGIPEPGPGEVVHVVAHRYLEAFEGETVDFEWEPANQDGYAFRATTVRPHGRFPPGRTIRERNAVKRPGQHEISRDGATAHTVVTCVFENRETT